MRTEMRITEMSGDELITYAEELGAYPEESFEETAKRLHDNGEKDTGEKFDAMAARWWELEATNG